MGDVTAPGPLVEVEWIDSAGRNDWHEPDDARRSLDQTACISVGYLAEDDERGVLLVMGVGAVGLWLSSMAIPRAAVLHVRRLRSHRVSNRMSTDPERGPIRAQKG